MWERESQECKLISNGAGNSIYNEGNLRKKDENYASESVMIAP